MILIMDNIKIRRAPNGKLYAVLNGRPICDEDGGLRYSETEQEVRDALRRCDLVLANTDRCDPSAEAAPNRPGKRRR